VDKQQRPISKFLNIEWIVSFVCNVIFYNISVNQVGSFIGTVWKKKKTFKLAYDNYIIFFTKLNVDNCKKDMLNNKRKRIMMTRYGRAHHT
jgi:hypothetical protein